MVSPLTPRGATTSIPNRPVLLPSGPAVKKRYSSARCWRRPCRSRAPRAVDWRWAACGGVERAAVLELALAFQAPGVEGVNAPVTEVADQQVVAKRPEIGGASASPRAS